MELRIRNIFRPVAHFFATIFQQLNFSSRAITAFFYFLILTTAVLFLWLSTSPYSGSLLILSTAFIFITGFFDEVKREFLIITRDASGELILDRYADLLIIVSMLYYLNLGSYRIIYATQSQHLFLGAVLGLGMLFLNYYLRIMVKGERSPGFEMPAERLFILSAFATAGYTHESFEDFLLAGLLALALLIQGSIVYGLMQRRRDLFNAASVAKVLSPVTWAYARVRQLLKTVRGVLYKTTKKCPTPGEVFVEVGKPEEEQEYAFGSEPWQGYNYTVVLVDAVTEEPISNADVELTNLEADKTISWQTDEAGKGIFTEVMEGQYVLSIKAEGFKEEQYERYISIDSGDVFRLSKPSLDLSVV
ncbi:MAG: carboxypeptidase-like regulatory domain-containing protein, partial [Candidatus Hydrothermarchaeota archaeon]|nr:carboxypeptidase-like regulatory domain-containing protein [Candidatus Hydrothermarchaeota archaeon]